MSNSVLNYQYQSFSTVDSENLFLSKFSEVHKKSAPCFFWGKLTNPYILSRCLINLSTIVQSSFNQPPTALKDPIVTAGNNKIRFEGFSQCAGLYARVDVLQDGHDGEFLESGTTNVDFNAPLITALQRVKKIDNLLLSVGKKEVGFHKEGKSIIERKVPLPTKWLKGLTTVQHFFSESESILTLNKIQALQLFKTIPNGKSKTDYFIIKRGNKTIFSPVQSKNAIVVGGVNRLKLLSPLLPLINNLEIHTQKQNQSTTFILKFNNLDYIFSLSRDSWRGFSGEGAALEELIEDLPDDLIQAYDNYTYTNQKFDKQKLNTLHNLSYNNIDRLDTKLSAMGLLGFDINENSFFHRRLPFKLSRILSLNPRLKNAEKLLKENKVHIIKRDGDKIEANVEGSGVKHYIIIKNNTQKCTCTWYSRNQGERGVCKHILAVKKKAKNI